MATFSTKQSLFSLTTLSALMLSVSAHAELITTLDVNQDNAVAVTQNPELTVNIEQDKVLQCSQVVENSARLACYDKVVLGEKIGEKKTPLDLAKTVNTSFHEGKAVPILIDGKVVETGFTAKPIKTEKSKLSTEKDKEILEKMGVTTEDTDSYSALSLLYDLDRNDPKGILSIRPHQQMYVLPVWTSSNPNETPHTPTQEVPSDYPDLQHVEGKFQISFKTKILEDVFNTNADLWFGYTQQSYWQVYNESQSRPFRVSDYQPEIFVTQPVKAQLPFNGKLRMLGAGLVHESNGQADPLSRSWNRGYLMGGMEWGKLSVVPRLWFIFPVWDEDDDDNPDIDDYMGFGDVRWQYALNNRDTVGGLVRYNPFENKGAIQVDYARPITSKVKGFFQVFHGYGENIQDYNHKTTNVGVGLMFNDFSGL